MGNLRIEKIGIDTVKSVCGVEQSEMLFGIELPPEHQCQFIDKMIKVANDCEKYAASIGRSDDVSECHSTARDIEWEISSFQDSLEKLRKKIEALRDWGEQWKRVAKRMGECNPESLSHVMEDDLFPKFEEYLLSSNIM